MLRGWGGVVGWERAFWDPLYWTLNSNTIYGKARCVFGTHFQFTRWVRREREEETQFWNHHPPRHKKNLLFPSFPTTNFADGDEDWVTHRMWNFSFFFYFTHTQHFPNFWLILFLEGEKFITANLGWKHMLELGLKEFKKFSLSFFSA